MDTCALSTPKSSFEQIFPKFSFECGRTFQHQNLVLSKFFLSLVLIYLVGGFFKAQIQIQIPTIQALEALEATPKILFNAHLLLIYSKP